MRQVKEDLDLDPDKTVEVNLVSLKHGLFVRVSSERTVRAWDIFSGKEIAGYTLPSTVMAKLSQYFEYATISDSPRMAHTEERNPALSANIENARDLFEKINKGKNMDTWANIKSAMFAKIGNRNLQRVLEGQSGRVYAGIINPTQDVIDATLQEISRTAALAGWDVDAPQFYQWMKDIASYSWELACLLPKLITISSQLMPGVFEFNGYDPAHPKYEIGQYSPMEKHLTQEGLKNVYKHRNPDGTYSRQVTLKDVPLFSTEESNDYIDQLSWMGIFSAIITKNFGSKIVRSQYSQLQTRISENSGGFVQLFYMSQQALNVFPSLTNHPNSITAGQTIAYNLFSQCFDLRKWVESSGLSDATEINDLVQKLQNQIKWWFEGTFPRLSQDVIVDNIYRTVVGDSQFTYPEGQNFADTFQGVLKQALYDFASRSDEFTTEMTDGMLKIFQTRTNNKFLSARRLLSPCFYSVLSIGPMLERVFSMISKEIIPFTQAERFVYDREEDGVITPMSRRPLNLLDNIFSQMQILKGTWADTAIRESTVGNIMLSILDVGVLEHLRGEMTQLINAFNINRDPAAVEFGSQGAYMFMNRWLMKCAGKYMVPKHQPSGTSPLKPLDKIFIDPFLQKRPIKERSSTHKALKIAYDGLNAFYGIDQPVTTYFEGFGEPALLPFLLRLFVGKIGLIPGLSTAGKFGSVRFLGDISVHTLSEYVMQFEKNSNPPRWNPYKPKMIIPDGEWLLTYQPIGDTRPHTLAVTMEFGDQIDWAGVMGLRTDGYIVFKDRDARAEVEHNLPSLFVCADAYYEYYMQQIASLPAEMRTLVKHVPVLTVTQYQALIMLLNPRHFETEAEFLEGYSGDPTMTYSDYEGMYNAYIAKIQSLSMPEIFTDLWEIYREFVQMFGYSPAHNTPMIKTIFALRYKFTGDPGVPGFEDATFNIPAAWITELSTVKIYDGWEIVGHPNIQPGDNGNQKVLVRPTGGYIRVPIYRVRGPAFYARWDPRLLIGDPAAYWRAAAIHNTIAGYWNHELNKIFGGQTSGITNPFTEWLSPYSLFPNNIF